MPKNHTPTVAIAALTLLACGCAQFQSGGEKKNYETVVGTPNRDTELAKKLTRKAEQQLEKGHIEKAEQSLQEALVADVSYGPAHNNLGKLYFSERELYLAAWEFEYAIRTMAELPEPHNNLGLVYEEVGKLEDAISYYTTAYELEPTNAEYIGNLVRARLRSDDRDPLAKPLLQELLMYETRPNWIRWAKEHIGLGKLPDTVGYEEYIEVELPEGRERYEEAGPEQSSPTRGRGEAERLPPPEPETRTQQF
ncbi:MAG: tetratricopeptide repeat protein [Planctomycetales bacterium]|nr:tetratricopeptide repeat protein [Planctomycetales bacterium]